MKATAKAKARELLKKYCIEKPGEIDIEAIANAEFLIIQEEELEDYDGRINHVDNYGLITINKNIREQTQKKYTAAHEMGHFYVDTKRNRICKKYDITYFKTKNEIENEANVFAAELLMPEEWFASSTGQITGNADCVLEASEKFRVSLSAAAIRYSQIGKTPAAVIMSQNGKVKWSSINELFPFQFIPKGYTVNQYSAASDFYTGKVCGKMAEEVSAEAWFLEDYNYQKIRRMGKESFLNEQNIAMPNYNAVLTILWGID